MSNQILNNPEVFPTDSIIFYYIGEKKSFWINLFDYIKTEYPALSVNWNYYKDGKSWLLKATRKNTTIFWLSLLEDSFRVTFYFNAKTEYIIDECPISADLKATYKNNKTINKIKPLTIFVNNQTDIDNIKILLEAKYKIK